MEFNSKCQNSQGERLRAAAGNLTGKIPDAGAILAGVGDESVEYGPSVVDESMVRAVYGLCLRGDIDLGASDLPKK